MSLVRRRENHSFTSFLSATPEYNYCGRCLLGVFEGKTPLLGRAQKAQFKADFQKDSAFFNSIVRFLFTVRTDKEIEEILDRMEPCSCLMDDPTIHRYHQLGKSVETDIFPMLTNAENQTAAVCLMANLFRLISVALDSAHVRAVAKGKSTFWPTSPKDLIPFGAENLVQSLLQWSRLIPDTIIFRLAGQCIQFCGALVLPSFLAARFTRHVVQAGRNLADRTWHAIRKPNPQKRRQIGISFGFQAAYILAFLGSTLDDQTIHTATDFIDGVEIKSIQLLSILSYLATDERLPVEGLDVFLGNVEQRASRLYSLIRGNYHRVPEIPIFPRMYELIEQSLAADRQKIANLVNSQEEREDIPEAGGDSSESGIDPSQPDQTSSRSAARDKQTGMPDFDLAQLTLDESEGSISSTMTEQEEAAFFEQAVNNAITFLRVAKFQLRCSLPACPNSIQSTGRKFQRCTRCRLALYCGKECQVKAWKDKAFPHSKACQVVSKLVRLARGDDLLFHCPHPEDPKWFPPELRIQVRDCWWEEGVLVDELVCILLWGPRLLSSGGELPMMDKPEPGWDDYHALVGELAGSSSDRQGILLLNDLDHTNIF